MAQIELGTLILIFGGTITGQVGVAATAAVKFCLSKLKHCIWVKLVIRLRRSSCGMIHSAP